MADRTLNEEIAEMLEWKPFYYGYEQDGVAKLEPAFLKPDGSWTYVISLPPFATDKGTALGALETWCKKTEQLPDLRYSHHDDEWQVLIRTGNRHVVCYHKSLARAICEAMKRAAPRVVK